MSSSYSIDTAFDALDESVYDVFNVDAYCSLSSPVSSSEPVPHSSAATSRLKRYPKTRGHPRPSPSISLVSPSAVASTTSIPVAVPAKPDKGKSRQHAATSAPPTSPVDPPVICLHRLRRPYPSTAPLPCVGA